MLDTHILKAMLTAAPNYHAIRVGKGYMRTLFSVCPCCKCQMCETICPPEEEQPYSGRKVRWCKRLRDAGLSVGLSMVGEYGTCDRAVFDPTRLDDLPLFKKLQKAQAEQPAPQTQESEAVNVNAE